jgi:hypothetical protein
MGNILAEVFSLGISLRGSLRKRNHVESPKNVDDIDLRLLPDIMVRVEERVRDSSKIFTKRDEERQGKIGSRSEGFWIYGLHLLKTLC